MNVLKNKNYTIKIRLVTFCPLVEKQIKCHDCFLLIMCLVFIFFSSCGLILHFGNFIHVCNASQLLSPNYRLFSPSHAYQQHISPNNPFPTIMTFELTL